MLKIKTLPAAALALLFCGAAGAQQTTVRLKTADGCALEAFYLAPSSGAYVFLNTHGLGSSKNEWGEFQAELKKAGYGYLSLDLRGHNESSTCNGRKADYRAFSGADWNGASRDIEAAAAWLEKKGFPGGRLIFCGASIGANLSLKAAVEARRKPAALVLLSPGLEYAGVKTEENFLKPGPYRVLVAASDNDAYAWQSSVLLARAAQAKRLPADFIDGLGGHGVNMLKNPGVTGKILGWVSRLKAK
jgi:pimeloyl-ACP methyl ester carboxylesterase